MTIYLSLQKKSNLSNSRKSIFGICPKSPKTLSEWKFCSHYRFGFDIWGVIIFLVVMLPTCLWCVVPAPADVLRVASRTPIVDAVGSVFQVLLIVGLCCVVNQERQKIRFSRLVIWSMVCILIYFAGWAIYYLGIATPLVILLMTVPPCVALQLFALDRQNLPAVVCALGFTICHLIFAIVNFMM